MNGVFGTRMAEVAERAGARRARVEAPWGQRRPRRADRGGAARTRGARSWSRWCTPRRRPAPGSRSRTSPSSRTTHGALLLADCVTSLGGVPVEIDALGHRRRLQRDAEVPLLSARPVAGDASARARSRCCAARKTKVQSWYLDLDAARAVLGRGARLPPHRADHDELRAARGAPPGRRGRAAGALRAPSIESRGARRRASKRSGSRSPPRRATGCRC